MGIDHYQFLHYIIEPSLIKFGYDSLSARILLLGTAEIESQTGRYLHQLKKGHAKGVYQCEPTTYIDLFANYINRPDKILLRQNLNYVCNLKDNINPPVDRLVYDLQFATVIARIHYLRKPAFSNVGDCGLLNDSSKYKTEEIYALPFADDAAGLAAYHKKYYNTSLGKTDIKKSVPIFQKLINNFVGDK